MSFVFSKSQLYFRPFLFEFILVRSGRNHDRGLMLVWVSKKNKKIKIKIKIAKYKNKNNLLINRDRILRIDDSFYILKTTSILKGESRKQEKKDTKNHNMMKLLWFYRIGNLAHYIKYPFCFFFFFFSCFSLKYILEAKKVEQNTICVIFIFYPSPWFRYN